MVDILWKDLSSVPQDTNALDARAIQESINNLLSTVPGERLFNPSFGCDLDSLLFEVIDEFTSIQIKREIIRCIQTWDPRIMVSSETQVIPNPDDNQYSVTLVLTVYGIASTSLNFSLNRLGD